MKNKLTFAFTVMTALMLCSFQKTNAQSWIIGGNTVSSDTTLGTKNAFALNLITKNLTRMHISAAGRIGMGTNSVNKAKLTVDGTVGNTMAIFGNSVHGISLVNDIPTVGFNNYYNAGWKTLNTGYSGWIGVNSSTGSMQFATAPNAAKDAAISTPVRMIILQNGDVGIGTTVPVTRLEVKRDDGNYLVARFTNSSTTGDRSSLVDIQNGDGVTWRYGAGGTNNGFGLTSGQFYIERIGAGALFTMNTNGNVGIGTRFPGYKLDVCGTIRSKEIIVQTGWCDYVFNKDYKLRSLTEVEQFIQQNKHLPNIPSATEVETRGLKVADMTSKMMEKIEELTLYAIEQNKQIQNLQEKLERLEQKAEKTKTDQ